MQSKKEHFFCEIMPSFRIAVDFHNFENISILTYMKREARVFVCVRLTIHMHYKKSESTVITSLQSEFLQGLYSPH